MSGAWGEGFEVLVGGARRVTLPMRTKNITNERGHWGKNHTRNDAQMRAVVLALDVLKPPELPITVLFTRLSPGELDDDGLRAALKSVRDQVARWYGVDDGPREKRITWAYEQRKAREHAVQITFTPRGK